MATNSTLHAEARRAEILSTINREGSAQLEDLATRLGVSAMTVRRDLDDLEAEGLLRRVRGGAVAVQGPRPFGERRETRGRAKQAIAAKAAALLPRDGAIALDASSTVGALSPALHSQPGLIVATNSLENFVSLQTAPETTPLLLGGERDRATGSFVGKLACDAAASMHYRVFFTSAAAIHPVHGTSEASLAESQVKRTLATNSASTVLCVDSSKLGSVALATTLALEDIDVLITELDPAAADLDPYRGLVEIR
ncbi:DeoR/GlpR family DNA-binding transcription regulator [Leucobacter albus]|uniref:Lactose phosphotransferase system repressor n=1 Tax=Leucobacter albus TaxID=272210 RepID=A0ABW3TPD0_9MICO